MNARDLFLFRWIPAIFTRRAIVKMDMRVKEVEEVQPWWEVRRQGHDSSRKNMDIQSLNLQTSSFKRIG